MYLPNFNELRGKLFYNRIRSHNLKLNKTRNILETEREKQKLFKN